MRIHSLQQWVTNLVPLSCAWRIKVTGTLLKRLELSEATTNPPTKVTGCLLTACLFLEHQCFFHVRRQDHEISWHQLVSQQLGINLVGQQFMIRQRRAPSSQFCWGWVGCSLRRVYSCYRFTMRSRCMRYKIAPSGAPN